jgi:16S rRNA (guanine527-N7)-methyltransferase
MRGSIRESGLPREAFHVKHSLARDDVSRETAEAFDLYAGLLLRWNRTVNLISARDEAVLWDRHIADSLQLVPLMRPLPNSAIDLGSGAGFPGLVLAVATGVRFHLIEADQRKAAFLREAARVTAAPVLVHSMRIEAAQLPPTRLITARGLAPLHRLLSLAAPLLAPDGMCLFPKGAGAEAELTHATARWHMRVDCVPSRTAADACILRISELTRVPSTA